MRSLVLALSVISLMLSACGVTLGTEETKIQEPAPFEGVYVGINLPPTQGSTNAGAFLPSTYTFDYDDVLLAKLQPAGITSLRIPVNAASSHDATTLDAIDRLLAAFDYCGLICFFDTLQPGEKGHGDGLPNSIEEVGNAWRALHARFGQHEQLLYELFNEPFGYPWDRAGAERYLADMRAIMTRAGLPPERCVLNGIGYASDPLTVAAAGWDGLLAYHAYPMWLPDGQRTQENFSNRIQRDLKGIESRTLLTEFGARLDRGDGYRRYHADGSASANENLLRGLQDAVGAMGRRGSPLRGAFHWHGWNNGDSYDFWAAEHSHGRAKVQAILKAVRKGQEE